MMQDIAVFGTHDENTLAQIKDVASRAARAALMADGHLGFVMPVGGVAAYRDMVSVQGVGYDIACLARGTPVTTADGFSLAIEDVADAHAIMGFDDGTRRRIVPHVGAVGKGVKATIRLTFEDGRTLVCTPDHRLLTPDGWAEARALAVDSEVLASPYRGVPHAPHAPPIAAPQFLDPGAWATVVRLLGFALGDGHCSADKGRVTWYCYDAVDALRLREDLARLGWKYTTYQRRRLTKTEYSTAVSGEPARLLERLGLPRGRKSGRWDLGRLAWVESQPSWIRAQLLDGFVSADMTTPYLLANGRPGTVSLIQTSDTSELMEWWQRLLDSLGVAANVGIHAESGRGLRSYRLQVVEGEADLLQFLSVVPWSYAFERRLGAAEVCSAIWQRRRIEANRRVAHFEARRRKGTATVAQVRTAVAEEFGVSPAFAHHAMYGRGGPRAVGKIEPDNDGEFHRLRVAEVESRPPCEVFDIVTADAAENFLANGLVVHNCGNAAIRTDLHVDQLGRSPEKRAFMLERIADDVQKAVSFGLGRRNLADDAPTDHALFDSGAWTTLREYAGHGNARMLLDKARTQLGTVGTGNHYVDVFQDESGDVWVGVHFGSRGFGHGVASGFLALGQGKVWGDRPQEVEVLLSLKSDTGKAYWDLMTLCGEYAYAGREWVARKVVSILGAKELELVHNHHNFAWKETHAVPCTPGESFSVPLMNYTMEELVVVRKGATPAFPGQKGFVGGSMGDDSVILEGAPWYGEPEHSPGDAAQRDSLFSTVHGAGRVMSRTQAAGKRHRGGKNRGQLKLDADGRPVNAGMISQQMMNRWMRDKGVILRGGDRDEAPQAYRRLPEVLAAQGDTIKVLHVLSPLIVCMAEPDISDPYKD